MPEFQPQKRRSLTDQQLYEEYNRTDEPKSKYKSGKPAKKAKKPAPRREAPPVSPERQQKSQKTHNTPNAQSWQKSDMRRQEPPKKREAPAENRHASQQKSAKPKAKPPEKAPPQRKKQRGSFILYYVLIGIVAIAAVSILSVTVLFNISSFVVTGNTGYSDDEIISACGIEKGDNLLRINIGGAEEQIVSKLVYIDSARISRGFPNRLVINVEPAKPVLSFAAGGSYYVISERGRLLEIGQISPGCPVVKGYSPLSQPVIGAQLEDDEDGRIAIALRMIEYMREYGLNDNCEINLSDTLNILLDYDGRVEMELGASTALEDKFYHAGILLRDEITAAERCTLILSNPDRVVKRPIYDRDSDDGYIVSDNDEEPPDDGEGDAGGVFDPESAGEDYSDE